MQSDDVVGTDGRRIVADAEAVLRQGARARTPVGHESPYGDGKAAERIVSILLGHTQSARALGDTVGQEAYLR